MAASLRALRFALLPFALAQSACTGAPRVLEPRAPPAHEMPPIALPQTPIAPGQARVVLDATDGPMRVSVQSDPTFVPPGADRAPSRAGELCVTPCAADLPIGRYRLFLAPTGDKAMGDSEDVTFAAGLNVYRRAPGKYESPSVSNAVLPGILLVGGIAALSLSPFVAGDEGDQHASTVPAIALAGLGLAAIIVGGIWGYDATRAVQQQGATTSWQEPTR